MKPNDDVQICADCRGMVNKALQKHLYQIPNGRQFLDTLARGKVFAEVNLVQAYQQLLVDDQATDGQTIITHQGAF